MEFGVRNSAPEIRRREFGAGIRRHGIRRREFGAGNSAPGLHLGARPSRPATWPAGRWSGRLAACLPGRPLLPDCMPARLTTHPAARQPGCRAAWLFARLPAWLPGRTCLQPTPPLSKAWPSICRA